MLYGSTKARGINKEIRIGEKRENLIMCTCISIYVRGYRSLKSTKLATIPRLYKACELPSTCDKIRINDMDTFKQ